MAEERKEQVVPEVEAAWEKLQEALERLLDAVVDREPRAVIESFAKEAQSWAGAVFASDPSAAFWARVLGVVRGYCLMIQGNVDERTLGKAIRSTRSLESVLVSYANLLGVEIPPEEEVPEAPSAAEEVAAEVEEPEGTPLEELGLPVRIHGALWRSLKAELGRPPFVEDVLAILEERGENFQYMIKNFGPKSLRKTLDALREKGFLPAEEAAEE